MPRDALKPAQICATANMMSTGTSEHCTAPLLSQPSAHLPMLYTVALGFQEGLCCLDLAHLVG